MRLQWLTSNSGLKLVSLVLATAIWFFVKGVTSDWRIIDGVPLEIKAKPGLTVLQTSASTINVTVRGTREDVRQVSRQDLSAVVDLTRNERTGEMIVKLSPRSIHHSRRVQVVQVEPSEITVNIDQLVERELPVQPQFTGELPFGVVVGRVLTKPETVKLRGPKVVLDSLSGAATLPIDLTGRRTSFRERVELTPLPFASASSPRHWVEVDVRIGLAPSVDSGAGGGVEGKP
ncbi:MAG: CdaR family protein [Verrucomicrobiia bacterium]|jgi:YbbR domain-containing protein